MTQSNLLQSTVLLKQSAPNSTAGTTSLVSKIGGKPHVPKNFTWPTLKDTCYFFLAQYNCEELTQPFYDVGFPQSGLISVFVADMATLVDSTSAQNAKVFYFKNSDDLCPSEQSTYTTRVNYSHLTTKPLVTQTDAQAEATIDYLNELRRSLNKKIEAKITLNAETLEQAIPVIEEKLLTFAHSICAPDPDLYINWIEQNTDSQNSDNSELKNVNSQTLEYIQNEDYALGWPYCAQGLPDTVLKNPKDWVNIITILDDMERFTMYDGHVPESITVLIKKDDLNSLRFDDVLGFQDWD